MTTSSVDFPDTLPCVSRIDGFQIGMSSSVIRTAFEAGNTRQRRVHARLPQEIALAWRVQNDDLQPLFAWLNTFGYDWFNLNLAGYEASQANLYATSIVVRLMSDINIQLNPIHQQNWWTVVASAEYMMPEVEVAGLRKTEDGTTRITEEGFERIIED